MIHIRLQETRPGFKLDTKLRPKPNKVKYAKPIRVDGILTSKEIK